MNGTDYTLMAMTAAIYSTIVALLRRDHGTAMSPDGEMYGLMASGERVPLPYCLRPLLPLLLRKNAAAWIVTSHIFISALGVVIYAFLRESGCNEVESFTGALIAAGCNGITRVYAWWPVLTDVAAMVFSLEAAIYLMRGEVAIFAVLMTIAALINEKSIILASLCALSLLPIAWLVIPALLYFRRFKGATGIDWIDTPFRTGLRSLTARKDYISALGVLPLAALHPSIPLCIALGVSALALIRSQDYARIIHWLSPYFILHVVTFVPDVALPLLPFVNYYMNAKDGTC